MKKMHRQWYTIVGKGTLISLIIGFILAMGLTPSQVAIVQKGEDIHWINVAPSLYWLNVIGITVWVALLGGGFTLMGSIGYFGWWKNRRDP
ncbi:hypothetical protein [Marininema halotolerans]|uniref:hypothetical protein n=1 Tax=Marininema halotolerans TaxID=1155944 RepID=UPI001124F39D|nr:hypothetical protein [Marininema halotolerans]